MNVQWIMIFLPYTECILSGMGTRVLDCVIHFNVLYFPGWHTCEMLKKSKCRQKNIFERVVSTQVCKLMGGVNHSPETTVIRSGKWFQILLNNSSVQISKLMNGMAPMPKLCQQINFPQLPDIFISFSCSILTLVNRL